MTKNDSTVSIFSELTPQKKPILLKKAGRTWGIYEHIKYMLHVYVTTCNDLYGLLHLSQDPYDQAFWLFLHSIKQKKSFYPHNDAHLFFPNVLTLTKSDHDHGVSNTYEYAKQSLPGQSDKWNIHASDEHTYSNKSSMPHRQSMIFTQICSGTLMGQNKSTRANRPEKWETHKIPGTGTWLPEREQQCNT